MKGDERRDNHRRWWWGVFDNGLCGGVPPPRALITDQFLPLIMCNFDCAKRDSGISLNRCFSGFVVSNQIGIDVAVVETLRKARTIEITVVAGFNHYSVSNGENVDQAILATLSVG